MKKMFCGIVAATVLSSGLHAETFNVTRLDDPVPDGCNVNDCSLREAAVDADQTAAKDTIVLPAGIYLIDLAGSDNSGNTGDLDISTDMEFLGAPSTIDAQTLGRIMDIRSGANVILRNLVLQNANTSLDSNGSLNGGAIQVDGGSLTLDSVTFDANRAQTLGGAIRAFGDADVQIDYCMFVNNSSGNGAAIHAATGITVRNTIFRDNRADVSALGSGAVAYLSGTSSDSVFERVVFDKNLATGSGGALQFLGRSLLINGLIATDNESTTRSGGTLAVPGTAHAKQVEIVNSLFEGNSAGDDGGAISFSSDLDTLDIQHSSFVSNTGNNNGGALYITGGDVIVINNTFSGNQTTDDGGAIYVFGAGLTLRHTTFSEGSANRGTALVVNGSSDTNSVELANNLVDGGCFVSDNDSVTSLGGNIEGPGDSCDLDSGTDLVSQNFDQLGLQPLIDNPGQTPTHKLTLASKARGQGNPVVCGQVQIDQLFERRGINCNSGADESDTIFRDGFENMSE